MENIALQDELAIPGEVEVVVDVLCPVVVAEPRLSRHDLPHDLPRKIPARVGVGATEHASPDASDESLLLLCARDELVERLSNILTLQAVHVLHELPQRSSHDDRAQHQEADSVEEQDMRKLEGVEPRGARNPREAVLVRHDQAEGQKPEDHQLHLQFLHHFQAGFVVRKPRVHPLRRELEN